MVPKINRFIKFRSIQGTFYVMKNRQAYKITGIGEDIWNLIDGNNTFDDIVKEISGKYSQPTDVISNDINSFLNELEKRELITL